MKKDRGYLSIGEFSEISRASIDSLRYFERKGVIQPAYVDPDSGYRYYTLNQIYEISLAKAFTEAGIPLSELRFTPDKGDIPNLNELFSYCEEVADRAYRDAFGAALRMRENHRSYIRQIREERLAERKHVTSNHLLLISPIASDSEQISYRECIKKVSDCIKLALEADIIFLSEQGAIRYNNQWYGFVSVYREPGVELKLSGTPQFMMVDFPSQEMVVRSLIGSDISDCFDRALKLEGDRAPSIIQEAWGYSLATGFYAFDVYYEPRS